MTTTNDETLKKIEELTSKRIEAEKLLNISSGIIIKLDRTGKISLLNKSGNKILGYEPGELNNKNWFSNCIPKNNRSQIKEVFAQLMQNKGQNVVVHENDVLCKDGSIKTILWHNTVLLDDSDQATGLLSSGEDITERKQAREELKESAHKFNSIFESNLIGIIFWNAAGDITDANEVFLDLMGYTKDELLNGTVRWKDMTPPEYLERDKKLLKELAEIGYISPIEKEYYHKDGHRIPIILGAATFPGFKISGVAFVLDITHRKEAEEKLKTSEERLKNILDSSPFPVAVVDVTDDNILYWSKSAKKLFGYDPKTTQDWYDLAYPDPNYQKEVIERWKPLLEIAQKTSEAVNTGEYRIACKDGSTKSCELYAQFIPGNLIVTLNNITARKQAEDKLKHSEEELKKAQKITHIGSWYLDVATNQVTWTEELYRMYGFDPTLPVPPYTEHMKLFTPESWELLSTSLAKTQKTGNPYELELITVRKDGTNGWMWVRGEVVLDSKGNTIGLWGAAQDISERKQIEETLRVNEEKYRLLFDNMSEGFALHKIVLNNKNIPIDYTFIDVNKAFELQTGLIRSKIVGQNVTKVLPGIENDSTNWIEIYGDVATTGKSVRFENYTSPLNKWYSVTAYSPKKGYFATIITDITNTKKVENKLLESEEKFRNITENINEMVFITDGKGVIKYCSPASINVFGIASKDMEGRLFMKFLKKTDIPHAMKKFLNTLRTGKNTIDMELNMINGNGDIFTGELSASVYKTDKFKGTLGVIRDITDRKKTEEELIKYRDSLEMLVRERTKELEKKNKELDQALKVFVGRELTIRNLEEKIRNLEKQLIFKK